MARPPPPSHPRRLAERSSSFDGGCFGADGETFFLNQQGGRLAEVQDPAAQPAADAGLTYAIWGPFGSGRRREHDDDRDRDHLFDLLE